MYIEKRHTMCNVTYEDLHELGLICHTKTRRKSFRNISSTTIFIQKYEIARNFRMHASTYRVRITILSLSKKFVCLVRAYTAVGTNIRTILHQLANKYTNITTTKCYGVKLGHKILSRHRMCSLFRGNWSHFTSLH